MYAYFPLFFEVLFTFCGGVGVGVMWQGLIERQWKMSSCHFKICFASLLTSIYEFN